MELSSSTAIQHTRRGAGQKQRRHASPAGEPRRSPLGKKPYKAFPLTPHRNGQFCKKIRGKFYYFGSVSDPEKALAEYHKHCNGLHSGHVTSLPRRVGAITLRELVNEFLNAAVAKRDTGRLTDRTFADYHRVCGQVIRALGRDLPVSAISREQLATLHQSLSHGVSAVTLNNRVGVARSLFKYAFDEEFIDQPLRLKALPRPEKRVLRRERAKRGRQDFHPGEIRRLIDAAALPLRAMILLGINCGLGNSDIGELKKDAIDLDRGRLDFPRTKTGVARRCPLWPETVRAVQAAIKHQAISCKRPVDAEAQRLLFVTRKGHPFVRRVLKINADNRPTVTEHDAIATSFNRLMEAEGIDISGLGFYGLRRSFETIGGETGHQVAVDHIMGHVPASSDMGAVYRQHVADAPLREVTEHIRRCVFGPKARK